MSRIPAGRLRQRVDIMRAVKADNGKGGYVTTWSAIASNVPVEVLGLTGEEALRDKVLLGVRVHRITLRYRSDLAPKDQLRYQGDDLNIRSAVDPDGRRERLVIIADNDGAVPTG